MEDYLKLRASLKSSTTQAAQAANHVPTNALNQSHRNPGQMSQPYIAQEVCVIERTIRQEPMTLNSCSSAGLQGLGTSKLTSELLAIVSGKQQHVGLPSYPPSVTSQSTGIPSRPQLSTVNSTTPEGLLAWPAITPSSLHSGSPLSGGSRSSSGVTAHASQCGQVQELSVSTSDRLVTGAHENVSFGFGPLPDVLMKKVIFDLPHEQRVRTSQQNPPPQWLTETVSRQQQIQSMVTSLPMLVGNSALQKIPQTTSNLPSARANHPQPASNPAPTGRPLVFCANFAGSILSGELCLTGAGRLGVVCACHNVHMSVTKFTQHAGIYTGNPGEAVFMQGGHTLVKWRKLFFHQYGVKLPEDHLGWDWIDLDSLEAGKATPASITQCSSKDFDASSGGKPSAAKSKTNVWGPCIAAGNSSVLHGSQTAFTSKHSMAQASCGQGVPHKQQENLSKNLGRELRPATTCVEFESGHFIPDPAQQGLSRNQATAGGLNSLHNTSKSAQIAMNEYHTFISDGGRQYLSSGQHVSAGGSNIKHLNYPRNNWNDGNDNPLKEKDNTSSSVELRLGQPSQYTQPTGSSISSSMLSASSIEHQKSLLSEHIMQRAWDVKTQQNMQNLLAGGLPKISGNLERAREQLQKISKNQSQYEGIGNMQSTCMEGLGGQTHQSGITSAFLQSGSHLVSVPMYHAANLNASMHHSNQNLSCDQQTNKVANRVLYEQAATDKSVMQCALQTDQLRKCMTVGNGRPLESQSLGALAQLNNRAGNELLEKAIQASLRHRSSGMDFSSVVGKGKIMPAGPSDCHMKSLFHSQVPSSTTGNDIKADPDSSSKGLQYSGSAKQLQQVPTSAVILRNQEPPLVDDLHLQKIYFKNSVTNEEMRGRDLALVHLEGLQRRAESLGDNGRKDRRQLQVIINKQDWVQRPLKVESDLNSKSPRVVSVQNSGLSDGQCGRSDGKESVANCEGFQSRAEILGDNGRKDRQKQQVIINKQDWVQRPLKVESDLNPKSPKVVFVQNNALSDGQCGRSDGTESAADCEGLQSRAESLGENGRKDRQKLQMIINKQDWVERPLKMESDLNSKSPKVVFVQNSALIDGQCGRSDGKASNADCEGLQSRAESLGDNGRKHQQQQQVIINKQDCVQRALQVESNLNSTSPKVAFVQNSGPSNGQCGRSDGKASDADCEGLQSRAESLGDNGRKHQQQQQVIINKQDWVQRALQVESDLNSTSPNVVSAQNSGLSNGQCGRSDGKASDADCEGLQRRAESLGDNGRKHQQQQQVMINKQDWVQRARQVESDLNSKSPNVVSAQNSGLSNGQCGRSDGKASNADCEVLQSRAESLGDNGRKHQQQQQVIINKQDWVQRARQVESDLNSKSPKVVSVQNSGLSSGQCGRSDGKASNADCEGLQSRAESLGDNGRKHQQQQQVIINKQGWVQRARQVESDLNSKGPKVVSLQNSGVSDGQCGKSDGKASNADCEGLQSRAESLGDNGKKDQQQQQVIINKQDWIQQPLNVESDLKPKSPKVVSLQNTSGLSDSRCGRSDGKANGANCDPQPHAETKHMGECSCGQGHKPLSGGEPSMMEVEDIRCNCFKCQKSSSTPRAQAVTRIAGQICLKEKGCQGISTKTADKDIEIGDVQKCPSSEKQQSELLEHRTASVPVKSGNGETSRDSHGQPLFSKVANRTWKELSDDVLSENAAKGTVAGANSRREPKECSETCSKSSENVMSGLSDEGQGNDEEDRAFQGQFLSKPLGQNGVCDKASARHKSHSSDSDNMGAGINPVSRAGDLTKPESPSSLQCPSSSNVAKKLVIKTDASSSRGKQQSVKEAEEKNDKSKIQNLEQKRQVNLKWKRVGSDGDASEFKKRKTSISCDYSVKQTHQVQDADLGDENERVNVLPEVSAEEVENLCESTAGKEKRLKCKSILVGNCSPSCVSVAEVKGTEETIRTAEEEGPTPERRNRTLIIRVPQQISHEKAIGPIHTTHDLSEGLMEPAVDGSDDLLERKKLGEGPFVRNNSSPKGFLEKRRSESPLAVSRAISPPKAAGSIETKGNIGSQKGFLEKRSSGSPIAVSRPVSSPKATGSIVTKGKLGSQKGFLEKRSSGSPIAVSRPVSSPTAAGSIVTKGNICSQKGILEKRSSGSPIAVSRPVSPPKAAGSIVTNGNINSQKGFLEKRRSVSPTAVSTPVSPPKAAGSIVTKKIRSIRGGIGSPNPRNRRIVSLSNILKRRAERIDPQYRAVLKQVSAAEVEEGSHKRLKSNSCATATSPKDTKDRTESSSSGNGPLLDSSTLSLSQKDESPKVRSLFELTSKKTLARPDLEVSDTTDNCVELSAACNHDITTVQTKFSLPFPCPFSQSPCPVPRSGRSVRTNALSRRSFQCHRSKDAQADVGESNAALQEKRLSQTKVDCCGEADVTRLLQPQETCTHRSKDTQADVGKRSAALQEKRLSQTKVDRCREAGVTRLSQPQETSPHRSKDAQADVGKRSAALQEKRLSQTKVDRCREAGVTQLLQPQETSAHRSKDAQADVVKRSAALHEKRLSLTKVDHCREADVKQLLQPQETCTHRSKDAQADVVKRSAALQEKRLSQTKVDHCRETDVKWLLQPQETSTHRSKDAQAAVGKRSAALQEKRLSQTKVDHCRETDVKWLLQPQETSTHRSKDAQADVGKRSAALQEKRLSQTKVDCCREADVKQLLQPQETCTHRSKDAPSDVGKRSAALQEKRLSQTKVDHCRETDVKQSLQPQETCTHRSKDAQSDVGKRSAALQEKRLSQTKVDRCREADVEWLQPQETSTHKSKDAQSDVGKRSAALQEKRLSQTKVDRCGEADVKRLLPPQETCTPVSRPNSCEEEIYKITPLSKKPRSIKVGAKAPNVRDIPAMARDVRPVQVSALCDARVESEIRANRVPSEVNSTLKKRVHVPTKLQGSPVRRLKTIGQRIREQECGTL